jgi:hypothetical protein
LFCRNEAELARGGDLDRLTCARIAALTRRAVFDLELAETRKADLFAFRGGLNNTPPPEAAREM